MKIILLAIFSLMVNLAFAQDKNEQLYHAITVKDTVQAASLLKDGADANYKKKVMSTEFNMLILAVQNKETGIVKLLLDHGAKPDERDMFNSTALMYAAYFGNKPMIQALLAHGADPMAHDDQGNSVLSGAKESKNPEVIALIEGLQKK